MTRVSNPGRRDFYIHLVDDLSRSQELDYGDAFEFGTIYATVHDGHIYVADRESIRITKYEVTPDRQLQELGTVSLQQLGVVFPIVWWASTGQPYVLDFGSAQVVRFDPESMTVIDSTPIPEELMERDGLPAQPWAFDGVESQGRAFFTWSWYDLDSLQTFPNAAVAAFPLDGPPAFGPPLDDRRCGVSDTVIPWTDDSERVYIAGLGHFSRLDGERSCVVRTDTDSIDFDSSYVIDLTSVAGSEDIYGGWRIGENRLLINHLPIGAPLPDIESNPLSVFESQDYVLSIVDIDELTAVPVPLIPPGGVMSSFDLRLDGDKYVQVYQGDEAILYRVLPDGSSEEIISAGRNGDFQFLGRVR